MSLSKMSLSKLSKLPNEVLSSVLNHPAIPLGRRLSLRLHSTRWADIIEDGLKKESSLSIRDNEFARRYREPNDLVIKPGGGLTAELINTLVRLFSGLSALTIALGSASWGPVPSLFILLDTSNLATVTLFGEMKPIEGKLIARGLLALPALTWLTVDGHDLRNSLLPHLMLLLPRLVKLTWQSGLDLPAVSLIASSLSPRCTHLMLELALFDSFRRPLLAQLSASLTHLHLHGYFFPRNIWKSLSVMHALTSLALDLGASGKTLTPSIFSYLAPLTRLTEVKLYGFIYTTPVALPTEKVPPLAGIKRLTLEFFLYNTTTPFDGPLFFRTISLWFPALTAFTLIIQQDRIADLRANLGRLPFAVEILNYTEVTSVTPDW